MLTSQSNLDLVLKLRKVNVKLIQDIDVENVTRVSELCD